MPEKRLATLHIQIINDEDELDQDQLDESNRELYQELKNTNADDVKLISETAPEGTKGGAEGIIIEIAVALAAHYAPEVIEQIRSWVTRSTNRKVKLIAKSSGKEVQVTISSSDLQKEEIDRIVNSILASAG
jgi:hypothetical protein